MAVTFDIQFRISVSTKVIRLTNTSSGFTFNKGCFKVQFPNGVVRNLPDFSTPDITTSINYIDIPCEVDVNGSVITGSYVISFAAIDNAGNGQTPLSRTFDFNWIEPTNGITNLSDVLLPEVVFSDVTSYSPVGSFTGTLTRTLSSSFPSTSEVSGNAPITSTVSNTIRVISATNYYEGVYTPTSNVSVAYTHSSNSWLTILYTRTFSSTFAIKKCPSQLELVTKINSYRAIIDAYKLTNDTQFNILSNQYDIVISLYSHLIARYNTSTQDGSEPILRELLSILEPYAGTYSYQATKMLPFALSVSATNSFVISDGTNIDTIPLGSTLTFASGNSALLPIVTDNIVTYSPTFGTALNTFAQGNDSRFHNPVTIGTANGLSISTQALSLAAATTGSAGAMSASDKTKLDGIATGATANTGTVTSVALTVPAAFSISGSPITTSGTLAIAAAGTSAQYITGAGALATLNTANVPENTNLYFTTSRARTSISLTTTGTTGAATYDNATGILNIPSYIGGVTSFNTRTGAIVLSSSDVTTALTYTPYNASNPSGYISSITSANVISALGYTPENAANKGIANGYASLDGGGLVPSTQLPSYVDDVLEYTNLASFPATGETGKIYVDLATNKIYRWSGTTYIEVSPTVGTIWGGITGTLSNQTDLQNALNAKQASLSGTGFVKSTAGTISYDTNTYLTTSSATTTYVPYTGASGNVNLGTNNISANNFLNAFSNITASGTQVVLTVASAPEIVVNGSGGQTIKLPDATTLANGASFLFNNNQSSGAITVNNNSNTLVVSVPSGGYCEVILIDNTTAAGSYDRHFHAPSNVSWSTNTFDYAGSVTSATWNGVTVAPNRGGTGQSTYTDGQLLIGNTSGNTLSKATLSAGTGITITNGNGSISIATTITQYTDALARASLSFTAGSGAYNSTTGVITIPTNTSQLTNGANYITLTSLSATSPIVYTNTTGVISIPVATTSVSGYLSSADWTTFNNKANALSGTANKIAKFTSTTAIGDSSITDTGSLITVNGLNKFIGTTASDTAPLGSELAAVTGTGASWTLAGTNLNVGGYSHTTGDVTPLTTTLAAVSGTYYQITYTITGRTAGSITIAYGGTSTTASASGASGPLASSTAVLTITPTTDFDGTVVLSIKSIGTSSASSTFANSSGTTNIEVRASSITSNTFLGYLSGQKNTTGLQNTFIGNTSGALNTSGNYNLFLGFQSGYSNNIGGYNTFIGHNNGYANTTGTANSFLGQNSGRSNTTGGSNTFIGADCGQANTTGLNNAFLGYGAGYSNTTGQQNAFLGASAGFNNTTGTANTFIGYTTGYNTLTGSNNSSLGYAALFFNTSGASNTVIGFQALSRNTTGSYNIALGQDSGRFISDGSTSNAITDNSIYIGTSTKALANNQTNQIVIGYASTGLGSNTTILGNSSTVTTAIYGNLLLGTTTASGYKLDVVGTTRIQDALTLSGSVTGVGNLSNYTVTASSGSAISKKITSTLVASANSDVLVGLDINPTFTNGSFTGIKNYWLQLSGNGAINGTNQIGLNRGGAGVFYASSLETTIGSVSSSTPIKFALNALATEVARFSGTNGNLLLNTTTDAGYRLDVAGTTRFQGTTASDTAPLGSEQAAVAASGTNWALATSATNLNVGGYTHTVGSTTALTTSLAAVSGTYYQITYTITGRTAGSITIAYGGTTKSASSSGAVGPQAISTAVLTITPTTDFDGTIVLSIKSIGTSSASSTFANSSGISNIEVRASNIISNTFIGLNAGSRNTTATGNLFYGTNAGTNNTTGFSNTFIGNGAGNNNIISNENVAIGTSALPNGGGRCTVVGTAALQNNTGANNDAFGFYALQSNTTGTANAAFGNFALYLNTTGYNNTGVGQGALQVNVTGNTNTAIGNVAMNNITSGNNNIALGASAARFIADGTTANTISDNSIYIGYNTKALASSQTNQIVIGYASTGLGSNTTVLGNSSTATTAIYGNLLLGSTTDAGYKLDVTGTARTTGATYISTSGANVGIGTTSPAGISTYTTLDIRGATGGGIKIGVTGSSTPFNLQQAGTDVYLNNVASGVMYFFNGDTERMRITAAGNVGIGTNVISSGYGSGNGSLTLQNAKSIAFNNSSNTWSTTTTGGAITYFTDNNLYIDAKDSASNMIFRVNGDTERMRITSGGNVGIGTASPTASALLQTDSTTQGFLPPRMTTTQKNAISSPATGLVVFDTTLGKLCVYSTTWQTITSV